MSKSYRLGELARRVGGEIRGDADRKIGGIAPLAEAGPDELSFLTNLSTKTLIKLSISHRRASPTS